MKKTNTDWQKEFDAYSKRGLSQPQSCKEKRLKYTTFRYHWERRTNKPVNERIVEIPSSILESDVIAGSEFLTLKIDFSGKAHLQVNVQFSLGRWS